LENLNGIARAGVVSEAVAERVVGGDEGRRALDLFDLDVGITDYVVDGDPLATCAVVGTDDGAAVGATGVEAGEHRGRRVVAEADDAQGLGGRRGIGSMRDSTMSAVVPFGSATGEWYSVVPDRVISRLGCSRMFIWYWVPAVPDRVADTPLSTAVAVTVLAPFGLAGVVAHEMPWLELGAPDDAEPVVALATEGVDPTPETTICYRQHARPNRKEAAARSPRSRPMRAAGPPCAAPAVLGQAVVLAHRPIILHRPAWSGVNGPEDRR